MPEDRRRRADAVLQAALELPAAEQAGFVAGACAGDADLEALIHRRLAILGATLGSDHPPVREQEERVAAAGIHR